MNDLVKENLLSQIWNFFLSRRGASWKDRILFSGTLVYKRCLGEFSEGNLPEEC